MLPIEIGKWVIIVLLSIHGQAVIGYDKYHPVDNYLSPRVDYWLSDLNAVEYGGAAVVIYNAWLIDNGVKQLYVGYLADGVAWYALFHPAKDVQLTGLTLAESEDTLVICGWSARTRHCWTGALDDNYPYFENFIHTEVIGKSTFLPVISK